MSPFRRAVSEGSNRHHRCVVQHHGLKTSDTFMALFLGYYFACLGMSQATRWLICQQTHIHTIYAYIYTHTVNITYKKAPRYVSRFQRDSKGHSRSPAEESSTSTWRQHAVLELQKHRRGKVSSSPLLPFCFHRGKD